MSGRETLVNVFLRGISKGTVAEPPLAKPARRKLAALLEELASLDLSSKVSGSIGLTIEKSRNRRRSGQIYEHIFDIVSPYTVPANFYPRLGDAFKELSLNPAQDTSLAIEYGSRIARIDDSQGTHTRVNWAAANHRPRAYIDALGRVKIRLCQR